MVLTQTANEFLECVQDLLGGDERPALARATSLGRRLAEDDVPPHELEVWQSRALRELDLDPTGLHSKPPSEIPMSEINVVVSFDESRLNALPEAAEQRLHEIVWELPDPRRAPGDENFRFTAFRDARDEIRKRLDRWFGGIAYSKACP